MDTHEVFPAFSDDKLKHAKWVLILADYGLLLQLAWGVFQLGSFPNAIEPVATVFGTALDVSLLDACGYEFD